MISANPRSLDRLSMISGGMTVVVASLVILGQLGLVLAFGYPGIFDEPTAVVLESYHRGGPLVPVAWFVFGVGTLMIVPLAVLYERLLSDGRSVVLRVSTAFGFVAGMAYVIGIMRWVLLARMLSARLVEEHAPQARDAIVLLFQAFDVYCGNGFGETIAPIAHGAWVLLLGVALLGTDFFPRWTAWAQILFGLAIATRPLEYAGVKAFSEIADIATGIWTVFLLGMGTWLVRVAQRRRRMATAVVSAT